MVEPYIGEIRMFGGGKAPEGWALCDGTVLPISQYDALYALIGNSYGGDGMSTFALPDLRGRVPMHRASEPVGTSGGAAAVTLTPANLPRHTHPMPALDGAGSSTSAKGLVPARGANEKFYTASANVQPMAAGTVSAAAGGGQPHDNMQPYFAINYIIALFGIFPSAT